MMYDFLTSERRSPIIHHKYYYMTNVFFLHKIYYFHIPKHDFKIL